MYHKVVAKFNSLVKWLQNLIFYRGGGFSQFHKQVVVNLSPQNKAWLEVCVTLELNFLYFILFENDFYVPVLYLSNTPGKNQLRLRKEPVAAENRIDP